MRSVYDALRSEPARRAKWLAAARKGTLRAANEALTTTSRPKKYVLAMFPYPSGKLHLGHVRVYAISDCLSRYYTMSGFRVLHPMGWDAFGLPAENAARDNAATSPEAWTKQNIAQMRAQLDELGFRFDWDASAAETGMATCDPEYYKWTQWMFLRMFERGLAYRAKATVNWDPVDKTVLANEQVDANGKSWRSGAVVEKKALEQWFLKTTAFGNELLDALDKDPVKSGWPENVRSMQSNWIGRRHGAIVDLIVEGSNELVRGFTTQPALALAAKESFLVLDATHPFWESLPATKDTAHFARHPVSGARFKLVKKGDDSSREMKKDAEAVGGGGQAEDDDAQDSIGEIKLSENDKSNSSSTKLDQEAISMLESTGTGHRHTQFRLKDWLVSRQRRWGAPIPIIHCADGCGAVPVPLKDLPVMVPEASSYNTEESLKCTCPKCGSKNAKRDTDSLDTFVDSSWYFYRYCDPANPQAAFDSNKVKQWMNVDVYVGGVEHAILHLLYARFFARFLHSEGLVEHPEPFQRLLSQGMVLGKAYKDAKTGAYLRPSQVKPEDDVVTVWEKMSKSKYNGVDPGEIVKKHGADVTRMAILFAAPPEKEFQWLGDSALAGQTRFLNRVWNLCHPAATAAGDDESDSGKTKKKGRAADDEGSRRKKRRSAVEQCITNVTKYYREDVAQFNVGIAELMKLTNTLSEQHSAVDAPSSSAAEKSEFKECLEVLMRMLAPVAPHFAAEAWEKLRADETDVHDQSWPTITSLSWSGKVADENSGGVPLVVRVKGNRVNSSIQRIQEENTNDDSLVASLRAELGDAVSGLKHIVVKQKDGTKVVNFIP